MKKYILIFAAASVMTAMASRAEAQQYPYCLSRAEAFSGMIERCEYSTMEQCQMSAQGQNGSCAANWRLAYAPPADRPTRKRRPQHAY